MSCIWDVRPGPGISIQSVHYHVFTAHPLASYWSGCLPWSPLIGCPRVRCHQSCIVNGMIHSEKYRQDGMASLPSLAFAVPVSAFGKMLVMSEGPDMRKFARKSSVSFALVAGVGFVKYCRNCRHEEKFSHHHITQDITNCLKIGKISIYYI